MGKIIIGILVLVCFGFAPMAQPVKLLKTTTIKHYPSASSLEIINNKIYALGDDATQILVLDTAHSLLDSIRIFESKQLRIPKKEKADLESSIQLQQNKNAYWVGFSSLSGKNRNKVVVVDVNHGQKTTTTFGLANPQILEWNLEGATLLGDTLVLANRANHTNTKNQLAITKFSVNDGVQKPVLQIIDVNLPPNESVSGISSITYLQALDALLFTTSTENTGKAFEDGRIGASYLGYFKNFSKSLTANVLKPEVYFNFSQVLDAKKHYKIESIAVESCHNNTLLVHLAADNDDGESTFFKLKWQL